MVMGTDGHKALFGCCAHERAIHWLSCHIHRCSNKTKQGNYCRWRTVGSGGRRVCVCVCVCVSVLGGCSICPPLKYPDGRQRDKANVALCNKAGRGNVGGGSADGNNAPTSTATSQQMLIKPFTLSLQHRWIIVRNESSQTQKKKNNHFSSSSSTEGRSRTWF